MIREVTGPGGRRVARDVYSTSHVYRWVVSWRRRHKVVAAALLASLPPRSRGVLRGVLER